MTEPTPVTVSPALLRGLVSRRTLLQGVGGVALTAGLAACGTSGTAKTANAKDQAAKDLSATQKVINWSNWPVYIDVDDKTKKRPTLDAFQAKTGIKVNYVEDYNDNDEFFAKVKTQLSTGKDTGRDVWCSTDWMVARLIRLNWVQKLDTGEHPERGTSRAQPEKRRVRQGAGLFPSVAERVHRHCLQPAVHRREEDRDGRAAAQ